MNIPLNWNIKKGLKAYLDNEQVVSYSRTRINDPAGNIIFSMTPYQDAIVLLSRKIKLEKNTEYQQNGDLLATIFFPS